MCERQPEGLSLLARCQYSLRHRRSYGDTAAYSQPAGGIAINGEIFADVLATLDATDRGLTFLRREAATSYSFHELAAISEDLAARWAGLGVGFGDRVILLVDDERDFVLSLLAAVRAGVVAVPQPLPVSLNQAAAYLVALQRVCSVSGATLCLAGESTARLLVGTGLGCRVATFSALQQAPPGPVGTPIPEHPAFLQFTSGSTGEPRGTVVTNRALLAHGRAMAEALSLHGDPDRGVSWLPLYHDMGLIGKVFVPISTQTSTWYTSPQRFIRDPVGFLRVVSDLRGTIVFAPNFAYALMTRRLTPGALEGLDLSAWRVAGCGAEPIRADVLRRFAAAYAPAGFRASQLVPCYGLAEATLAVSLVRPGRGMTTLTVDADRLALENRAAPADSAASQHVEIVSCGPPMPDTRIRIVGPAGEDLPEDVAGEIVVTSPYLAAGYHGDPAATGETWRGGWLHTADTGFLHDGELYVTGRTKDVIIVNGRNHHPHDIERVVESVPGVRSGGAVVFALASESSETVQVLVEAASYPPSAGLAAAVREAVQAQTSVPVSGVAVVRRGTIPKTSSGKLRRRLAAELFRTGQLVAVEPRPAQPPSTKLSAAGERMR
jgi:acyl-CoA synthetase (AMP-forming)/AMP-acid ligase II